MVGWISDVRLTFFALQFMSLLGTSSKAIDRIPVASECASHLLSYGTSSAEYKNIDHTQLVEFVRPILVGLVCPYIYLQRCQGTDNYRLETQYNAGIRSAAAQLALTNTNTWKSRYLFEQVTF
jgi:hypothetical protein